MTIITPPTLNAGQQTAADGFFEFLLSDEREMGITGPGGVGKTFLMGHMIDTILPRYFEACKLMGIEPEFDDVHMTATTNKAAEVLSLSTNRPTDTIYSFMNLKVTDDFTTGRSQVTKTRGWKVHDRKIIFIDECSMVDSPLDLLIQEGTHKCKIIYVGDHCQMAPVLEAHSPVFKKQIRWYELTEPMRNSGQPELISLCQQLRNTVETGVFHPIRIVPGVIDLLDNTTMPQKLMEVFAQQTLSSRVLAYTNSKVMDYNDYIRQERGLPDRFQLGELLVNNNSIQLSGGRLSVEEEVEIYKIADVTHKMSIEENVDLEVIDVSLQTRLGQIYHNVQVPVDREHYTELVKYYQSKKNWNRYFYLRNTFPDLRPRDASTIYKAQGSTYDSVFVDLNNLSTCKQSDRTARQLYVALSRPRSRIYLYGELVSKYGGLII